ncbi:hypothetical protein SAMN02799636_03882 [Methylobacterium sp. 275MFSha3.1]|uniref:hypothetical protein n=1 Tax=Methylobacterium sp. 275MFSha3.1 TaxID=1502746 RepID=UPI0008A7B6DA|nr:hypothetical protein [Methylobacterium sp. 275MFSha3.1]SEH78783.1 hypothetical protein SAMN02799636_03882 [Methylobacterium sp. 275MFSha3.1]
MSVFPRGWRRRTGTAACALALAPALALGAAGPAAAGHPPKGRGAAGVPDVPARLTVGPGGRDLRLAGDLAAGVAARVRAILAAHPRIARIHLTSDGGLVEEGAAIGALVAARGLATYVPDACASACTLIFVRGRTRYLATGGRLGFHAPYEIGARGRMRPVDSAPERAAYRAAGLPAAFVTRALAVPPAGIWIPTDGELRAAGIVTEVVGPDRFPDSTLDADPSAAGARAAILRNLPILRQAEAAGLDPIARWYRDGYAAGRPEAEAAAGLRRMAAGYLQRRFRAADDAVVRALGQRILTTLERAGAGDAAACGLLAAGDLVALDARLRAERPSSHGLAPLLARTRAARPDGAAAPAADPGTARSMAAAAAPSGDCAARIAATRRALDLPARESAAALRALFLAEPQRILASRDGP